MRVSVIIPAWNLWKYTFTCLESLAKHDDGLSEIVVVDNGSTDETRASLKSVGQQFFGTRFKYIRHESNMGFAIACNTGACASSGDILFFLNNDTTVTPKWLPPLLTTFCNPQTMAAGPLLLYPDGTCQHCGIAFTPFLAPTHIYAHFPDTSPALFSCHSPKAITGAALMVRRQNFFEVCGFNTDYCNGFEDLDLCLCLRKLGGNLVIAPKSIIIHHEGKTPGRHQDDTKNSRLFTERWGNTLQPDLHHLVSIDKYEVHLGPKLKTYIALNEQRRNEIAGFHFSSHDEIELFLNREPLWHDGYIGLVRYWEGQGAFEKALQTAEKLMLFFPLETSYRTVLRCAKQANNQVVMNDVLKQLVMTDFEKQKYKKKILYGRQQAMKWGDAQLTAIYDSWLYKYGTR